MTVVEFSAPVETPVEVLTEREQRARTLEAAALEIDMRGWAQTSNVMDGRVCAVGAICFVKDENYDGGCALVDGKREVPFDLAARIFGGGIDRFHLPLWNDASDRSAEDVTFLLRWRAEEIRDGR